VEENGIIYLLGSRPDFLDYDAYRDPEGILFKRRYLYVLRIDKKAGSITHHFLARARPAHTAMRVVGAELLIFLNHKAENDSFAMHGRRYRLLTSTLRPTEVIDVFTDRNWGWNPLFDELGQLYHKDFETKGNPVRLNSDLANEFDWKELV